MLLWKAKASDGEYIIIRANRWEDARQLANRHFAGEDYLEITAARTKDEPDVEIRWEGSDFNHGSTLNGRHMEVRYKGQDWERF